ncbi:hypothetical protein HY750_01090 [Candidatus Kuenenbacteria bacterium]|nr:hypothetical protein [Candidatus Kuenenbacteria bacterium]
MNQKTIITILGIVIIILIGATIYFAIINKSTPVDETASWQVYSNAKLGFEMKYPKDWKTMPLGYDFQGVSLSKDGNKSIFTVVYYKSVSDISGSQTVKSFDELKKDPLYKNVKEINFLENKALSVTFVNLAINLSETIIFVSKNNAVYKISYDDNDATDVSKQILTTFKFTK